MSEKGSGPGSHFYSAASRAKRLRTLAQKALSQADADHIIAMCREQLYHKERPISLRQVFNVLNELRARGVRMGFNTSLASGSYFSAPDYVHPESKS